MDAPGFLVLILEEITAIPLKLSIAVFFSDASKDKLTFADLIKSYMNINIINIKISL